MATGPRWPPVFCIQGALPRPLVLTLQGLRFQSPRAGAVPSLQLPPTRVDRTHTSPIPRAGCRPQRSRA